MILFYAKTKEWLWNTVCTPYDDSYVESAYGHIEPTTGRRYQRDNLTAAKPGGDTSYEWRVKRSGDSDVTWQADISDEWQRPRPGWEYMGVKPYNGRYWAYSLSNMIKFAKEGRLYHSRSGMPRYKRYLDEMPGVPLQDLWSDITPAGNRERLGYPTQKPIELLERIIQASSNKGDLVLDPFCGCGTTVCAAQKLSRQWIGIDITHLAVGLMRSRLRDMFGDAAEYEVIGVPADLHSAEALARQDRHEFEHWALGLIDARSANENKKGADRGMDGVLFFRDMAKGSAKKIVIQVKSGHVQASYVRDLCHVVEREKAAMGFLISLERPTQPMLTEALGRGYYHSPGWNRDYAIVQIRTIEQLLAHEGFDMPPANVTLAQAERVQNQGKQGELF